MWRNWTRNDRMKRRAGFSLVEVMCAILILGVGIVGLMQGITGALSSSKQAEEQTAAPLLAAAQIETLQADGFLIAGDREGDGEDALSVYHWRQSITTTTIDGDKEPVRLQCFDLGGGE